MESTLYIRTYMKSSVPHRIFITELNVLMKWSSRGSSTGNFKILKCPEGHSATLVAAERALDLKSGVQHPIFSKFLQLFQ